MARFLLADDSGMPILLAGIAKNSEGPQSWAIVNIDNRYSTVLAMIAGVMITATRLAIPQFYPSQATNGWANLFAELSSGGPTLFSVVAGIISFLLPFRGVSIFIRRLLCYKKH